MKRLSGKLWLAVPGINGQSPTGNIGSPMNTSNVLHGIDRWICEAVAPLTSTQAGTLLPLQ